MPKLMTMWAIRAVSFPFCICGTSDAATAHDTTIPAPAYRWGPGKSFCALRKVLTGPSIAVNVPRARRSAPAS